MILKESPVMPAFEQLKLLASDCEGYGDSDLGQSIHRMYDILVALCDSKVPDPFLCPDITKNGVRAEWPGLRWNVALDVRPDHLILFCLDELPENDKILIFSVTDQEFESSIASVVTEISKHLKDV